MERNSLAKVAASHCEYAGKRALVRLIGLHSTFQVKVKRRVTRESMLEWLIEAVWLLICSPVHNLC